ncbi:hypothetical protein NLP57_24605, partial [Escherichia coli]|nr:hypothetical protein [Escherichia coli]
KDAATELQDRIRVLAGPASKPRLLAGTFHGLAFKQLSPKGCKQQDIANEGDQLALVAQALKEADLDWKEDAALAAIEAIKMDFGRVPPGSVEERLYSAYQQALARNGKLDFQDMLCQAIEGMETGAISPYPFTHLLVD